MLVRETAALEIDLYAALHHQRPGDEYAMRVRDRTVPLISRQMRRDGSDLLTPQDGLSLIAGMPEIQRVLHFRDMPRDEVGIAAIAVAGKDGPPRGDRLNRAIRPLATRADHIPAFRQEKIRNARARHNHGVGCRHRLFKPRDQPLPGHLWHGMHAVVAVAWVEKIIKHMERDIVAVGQPVDGLGNLRHDGAHIIRIGAVLVLCHDIADKDVLAVGYGLRSLSFCARRRHQPRGQRCRAGKLGITLGNKHRLPGLAGGKRCRQAGRPATDDQAVDFDSGFDAVTDDHTCHMSSAPAEQRLCLGDAHRLPDRRQRLDRRVMRFRGKGGTPVMQRDGVEIPHMRVANGRGHAAICDNAANHQCPDAGAAENKLHPRLVKC